MIRLTLLNGIPLLVPNTIRYRIGEHYGSVVIINGKSHEVKEDVLTISKLLRAVR